MRKPLITILVCIGLLGLAGSGSVAVAGVPGACSVTEAHHRVHDAERTVARAQARLSEARHVESATRAAEALYGPGVARWVRLARRAGYEWWEMPVLMRVVDRESEGDPSVPNAGGSGALGLLQIMPEWADGSKGWYWKPWGLPALWSRTSARESLRHGSHMAWGNWGE